MVLKKFSGCEGWDHTLLILSPFSKLLFLIFIFSLPLNENITYHFICIIDNYFCLQLRCWACFLTRIKILLNYLKKVKVIKKS
jgi:hypothetical protein